MSFHRVRIHSDSAHGRSLKIWLDDKELHKVTNVELTADTTDVIRLRIELLVEIEGGLSGLPMVLKTDDD
jgi:hypothetical protein